MSKNEGKIKSEIGGTFLKYNGRWCFRLPKSRMRKGHFVGHIICTGDTNIICGIVSDLYLFTFRFTLFYSKFLIEYEQWIHYYWVHVVAVASCFRFNLPKCVKSFFALQINEKRSTNRIRSPRKSEIEVSQFIDQCFQAHNEYRSKHKVPPLILSKKVSNFSKFYWGVTGGKGLIRQFSRLSHTSALKMRNNIFLSLKYEKMKSFTWMIR